ncbi:MAG: hypothetical protein ACKO0M_11120 [Cyanobium sp.]
MPTAAADREVRASANCEEEPLRINMSTTNFLFGQHERRRPTVPHGSRREHR